MNTVQSTARLQKPVYTPEDTAYAWLCLFFAFSYCQATPIKENPFGAFLLILSMYTAGFVIVGVKKIKLSPVCIISAVSSVVIGSALILTDTAFLMNLSMAYSLASFGYFLYAALGNRIENGFSDYVFMDFVKLLFLFPFRSFPAIFSALFNKSTKKSSMILVKILVGATLAIFPTVFVLLLLSYDDGFRSIMRDLFDFKFDDLVKLLSSLWFTLPLGMYGFGLYASSRNNAMKNRFTAESCKAMLQKIRILPGLTAIVSVLPILFLYAVFFTAQWKYYVSGFTGVLPQNFSYAEYARQGFFELCAVSVINLFLIVSILFFMKRNPTGKSFVLKLITTVFCLCTMVLICTAVAKLVMYISIYGLTQKRIYAMWLMLLIGIVYLILALGQFLPKIKTVATCLTVAILMFACLAVCNVNALCASYNVDRYLAGDLNTVDIDTMEELGDSAVPSLVRLTKNMNGEKDPALKLELDTLLKRKADAFREEKFSFFSFSIPSALAKNALHDYVPLSQTE